MTVGNIQETDVAYSYTCRCLVTENEVYLREGSRQMYAFFGTEPADYQSGMLTRVRRQKLNASAEKLAAVYFDKGTRGEDFRVIYDSKRGDGSACVLQMDAYAEEKTPEGWIYQNIVMDITEVSQLRRDADRLRLENQDVSFLHALQDLQVSAVLFEKKREGICTVFYSPYFCKMLGYTSEEFSQEFGEDAFAPVYPADRERVRQFAEDNWEDTQLHFASYRLLARSGVPKWVTTSFTAFSAGGRRYLYGISQDIDTIKKQEDLLEKQYRKEQEFRRNLSETYLATFRMNITQDCVEGIGGMNPVIQMETGGENTRYTASLEQLAGHLARVRDRKNCLETFSREQIRKRFEEDICYMEEEYLYKTDGGNTMWIRCSMKLEKRGETGDLLGFCTISDIDRLKVVEILTRDILTREYDYIANIDADYNRVNLISVNKECSGIGEIRSSDDYQGLIQQYVQKHMNPEDRKACLDYMNLTNVLKKLDRDGSCSASFVVKEDGQFHYKRVDFYYIDQETHQLVSIRTDYTEMQQERIKQENELRDALRAAQQASVAKSEFLSRMSHEIRTPMNAIIGLDTIALQEQGLSAAMEDHLKKIGISARYLLSLINDILDMSRIESGKIVLQNREFDFHEMIDNLNSIIYSQCSTKGIEYDCVLKGTVEESYIGDKVKLQQVLLNILGNAVKFTPAGGKIHFMMEQVSNSGNHVRMRFNIADTGKGIDADFLPHIFDTFTQEDAGSTSVYGGTGLGLAISKNLVNLMDGSIDVHSIKGMGTDFTVYVGLGLPDEKQKWNTIIPDLNLQKLKTLVVDDDIIVCEHTQLVLKQARIQAEWVDSGAAAVNVVSKRHEEQTDFNLILLDWLMPDMDGIETARQIRKIVGPEVTILILTAYDWSNIENEAREAGVNNFIRKPVFVSSVLQAYQESCAQDGEAVPIVKKFDFKGRKILLVEDNTLNSEIAQKLLEMADFHVDTAHNGVEAIQKFTAAGVNEYSAILMDIRMPLMDGLAATQVIRRIKKADAETIPIIAMSANAFEEDVKKSLESGMNAHLSKPIEAEQLYQTLGGLIGK